jgi:hypothetical protein
MFNNIKRVAAVIALTGWMGVANASLIFDFSYGTTGNELIGEITGLVDGIDGQSQSADRISFTIATGIYSSLRYSDFGTYLERRTITLPYNEFVLKDKTIVGFRLNVGSECPRFTHGCGLLYMNDGEFIWRGADVGQNTRVGPEEFNGFVNRVDPTPAPEPSAVFLLALGLAGVSFSRYKKKS